MNNPDHNIEQYWLDFKQSMINFYNTHYMPPRPYTVWSTNLNKLQQESKYDIIETSIRDYISLYAIDVLRFQSNYHMGILVTNIKRWNELSTKYNFNSPEKYVNMIFLLIDIYNTLTNKCTFIDDDIKSLFSMIELYILYDNFNVLIDYSIMHKKQSMLDKIRLYCDQYFVFDMYGYIETKYNISINNNMSGKKILLLINLKNITN
jgi:hypothetical protein